MWSAYKQHLVSCCTLYQTDTARKKFGGFSRFFLSCLKCSQWPLKFFCWTFKIPKNLKQIKDKSKLKINFDWNQPNLKVIVTDTFKEKKGCFIPLFLLCFHYTTCKTLVRDLRPTLYISSDSSNFINEVSISENLLVIFKVKP